VRRLTALPVVALLVAGLVSGCGDSGGGATGAGHASAGGSAGGSPATGGLDVAAENAKPGTSAWRLHDANPSASNHAIEGYASAVSVLPGGQFTLYVSTTAPSFTVTAYRIGWYGGKQAREVWRSASVPGQRQSEPAIARPLNTVTTHWSPSLSVRADGWPAGDYLLKLVSATGDDRYVPITVRSTQSRGRVVLMNGVTTWQAYNTWGGYSLYQGPDNGYADRARAVSFDRPYTSVGADKFLTYEQPLVSLAERLGLPLSYATDVDLSTDPALFTGARALISAGHDEYWSSSMRANATTLRDAGVNIAFFGANAIFRHIRFESSELGANRVVVCYKSASEDPMFVTDKAETTQDWRDPPDPRPENVLTGTFYECNPVKAPFVVYQPDNWVFAGTGAGRGSSYPGLVGIEYDRVVNSPTTPRPITVLSHSPVTCQGRHSYSDAGYYTVPSGAGVFDTGSMVWVCALGSGCGDYVTSAARVFARQVTANVLRAFAAGPAGAAHPAADNLGTVREPTGPAPPAGT
jgi:hypothetical protein